MIRSALNFGRYLWDVRHARAFGIERHSVLYIIRHLWTFGMAESFGMILYCSASKPCSAQIPRSAFRMFGITLFGMITYCSAFRVFGITSSGMRISFGIHALLGIFAVRPLWIGTQRSLYLGYATQLLGPPGKSNPFSPINREACAQ